MRTISAAAVARDEMGHFLGASALVLEGIDKAEVGEALACREGLALLVLATDCANVVRSIQGHGFGRYETFVLEIKSRRKPLARWSLSHEGRQANFDAHLLARSSVSLWSSLRRMEFII
jgi:hypothetical protein